MFIRAINPLQKKRLGIRDFTSEYVLCGSDNLMPELYTLRTDVVSNRPVTACFWSAQQVNVIPVPKT
jgi:hypothetical protein